MQRISDGDDYPAGKLNDLAVCYFLKTESGWMFMPVDDRSEADKTLREMCDRADVLSVTLKSGPKIGRQSPVVWIAQFLACDD